MRESIRHLQAALEIAPDHMFSNQHLGGTRAEQGRLGESIRHYGRALMLNPHSERLHYKLGCVLVRVDRQGEAVAEFEHVLRLNPEHAEAREELEKMKGLQRESDAIGSG